MRVLYLSQYYPPEVGATQTRAHEMTAGLIRAGHQVTVLTEVPNHPEGIIRPEYRGRSWVREDMDGIDVIRVWVKTSPVKTAFTRLLFYLTYMINATVAGLALARGRYDVIYATSPPLFVGGAALILSVLRRIPLVFEVRDLWPAAAVALGELRSPWIIRLAEWLESLCYRRAQRMVVVTEGIRQDLLARGHPADKIALIPNGANTDLFAPGPIDQELRRRLDISPDTFVVVYTGLHGLIHGMEVILQAAQEFLRQGTSEQELLFLLIGEGVAKSRLMAAATEANLTNVRFLEAQPETALPAFIRLANAGVATTAKMPLTRGTLPVKMFSYMACGRPVLLAVEGEAVQLLEEAKAGLHTQPEDSAGLVSAVGRLMRGPLLCRQLGDNGRAFVEQHYSRQAQARQLAALLKELEV